MTDIDRRLLLGLAGAAGATLAAKLAQAGSLTPPPGPVAPTGKTTEQIEPRIDLLNAPASANVTNDASAHYIINEPGSYYISANIAVSKYCGIRIAATGVTLDLRGFNIYRVEGSPNPGQGIATAFDVCVTVMNGSVSGFGSGLYLPTQPSRVSDITALNCADGLYLGIGSAVTRCIAFNCSNIGIEADFGSSVVDSVAELCAGTGFSLNVGVVATRCSANYCKGNAFTASAGCRFEHCAATHCGSGAGEVAFMAGDGCVFEACVATTNTVQFGFDVGAGCVLNACVASANSNPSTVSAGFRLAGSTARGCVADSIATTGTPSHTSAVGFIATGTGNVFEGCTARANAGAGFSVAGRSMLRDNDAIDNAFAGIETSGADSVVQGNRAVSNGGNGILVAGSVNLVFANCARNNTAGNYSIVASNRVGTIVVPAVTASAINGNVGGTAFTTDPYANIAF